MKIAYISWSTIPSKKANSINIMKMCQAFKKQNIDVTLYCINGDDTLSNESIFQKYGIKEKFTLIRIDIPNLIQKIPLLKELYSAYKINSIIRKDHKSLKYDFIYGRSWVALYLLRNKYKFIFEAHMIVPYLSGGGFFIHELVKNKNLYKLVVISEGLKKDFLVKFPKLSDSKVIVLHDGADANHMRTDKICIDNSISKELSVQIGYVGHLYPGKCMEVLIEIAKKCDYCFHIIGGNDDWIQHWNKIIGDQGIKTIIFHGYVDNSSVYQYYNAFDICIMPFSKNIYFYNGKINIGSWTSPLKLFEAMAFGKAILVSKLPTIQEVMEDGIDCIMVDPDDINEWIRQLDVLVNDSELRNRLGEAAKNKLESCYTWDIRAQKIKIMFEQDTKQ